MPSERLLQYNARLAASGVRLTPQRFMVLEVLAASPGHTTADKVLGGVQARYPYVNKTTVYRTLELLTALGMVAMIDAGGAQTEYELLDAPHHHLICKRCGLQIELPDATLNPLRQLIEREHNFQPSFDHFALFGVCQACQEQLAAPGGPPP
ncbi:MAG TPA: Fur family transcriptional regulator [Chloroflexia bacterium]|nr:Fur family transcriptional regulator [Chloroflexia bacterium]